MTARKRIGSLEIGQDLRHHAVTSKIQRSVWVAGLIILGGALLGLTGPGPLAERVAGQKGSSLWMEYNRFERYQAPVKLAIHVGPAHVTDGRARLWFSREFIRCIELDHIDPMPEEVEAAADRFTYTFNVSASNEPVEIVFHFRPAEFGKMQGQFGANERDRLGFEQFYYP